MKKIALIGDGGHAKVIRDLLYSNKNYEIVAIFDDKYKEITTDTLMYAPLKFINKTIEQLRCKLIVAIGNNRVREQIISQLNLSLEWYETVIHPTAVIGSNVLIGNGTVIMPKVVVNADTKIGNHCIINTSAVVEHDNKIDDFVHIGPGAILTGGVTIEEGAQVSSCATIIPNVKVGAWSTIGAGATVIRDIPDNETAVGCPATIIREGGKII